MIWTISSSVLVCITIEGLTFAEPQRFPDQIPLKSNWETIDQEVLASSRRFVSFLEAEIAWKQKLIDGLKNALTIEQRRQLLQFVEADRMELVKHQRWVQEMATFVELTKSKPGLNVEAAALARLGRLRQELWGAASAAPPPREVKK
jgi:hypothetical protein